MPLLLLVFLAAAAPPAAQQLQDAQRARASDQAAQQAAAALAEAADADEQRLAAARVAAASSLRATEADLADAAARMAELSQRRDAATAQLDAQSRALSPLLPLLERLSRYPAETMLVAPMAPEDAVRGAIVLGGISRQLQQAAAALAAQRADIAALQRRVDDQRQRLIAAQAEQARQSAALDAQLAGAHAQTMAASAQEAAAGRRAAADAARADSLRAAIAALEAERKAAAAAPPAKPAAKLATTSAPVRPSGGWTVPVAGRIVRAFGDSTEAGPATGVSYQAPPGARVVSPCGGRVVFAGPFRSFGQLVIVDCGAATHVVLAGLDRLDATLGQSLQSGEPVGVMGPGGKASLYVELRRDGQAVNPASYLHSEMIFYPGLQHSRTARDTRGYGGRRRLAVANWHGRDG